MNQPGSVLIIDDKKSDALEFELVLRAEGYEVETAATAEAGLARAKQENFDVVLTGLHLSGSDEERKEGLDIIYELQAAKPLHSSLILLRARSVGCFNGCQTRFVRAEPFVEYGHSVVRSSYPG